MSRRSQFVNVFKLRGAWWTHRRYKVNGVWGNCYAPKWGQPIFSEEPLNKNQLGAILDARTTKDQK